MLYPISLVIDWSRLVLQQEQHKFRRQFYFERLEYWKRFLKSKATGCGSISSVFSSILLLCFRSMMMIIIIMIIIITKTTIITKLPYPIILTTFTCCQRGAHGQILNQWSFNVPCSIQINQMIHIVNLLYIMLSKLEWVHAVEGDFLRVSKDCIPLCLPNQAGFTHPNWIVEGRLVRSVMV